MARIANDLGKFGGDVQEFKALCTRLRTAHQTLASDFGALHSMWEGEAHNALTERFQEDYAVLGDLVDYLTALEQSLDHANDEYHRCENNVAGIIDSINV